MEREKNSKFLRDVCRNTEAVFDESNEVFDPEGLCGKYRLTRFLARLLGKEYKRHFKIAKKMEEGNKALFNEVMVR